MDPIHCVASRDLRCEPSDPGPHSGHRGVQERTFGPEGAVSGRADAVHASAVTKADNPLRMRADDVPGIARRCCARPDEQTVHPRMYLEPAGLRTRQQVTKWIERRRCVAERLGCG